MAVGGVKLVVVGRSTEQRNLTTSADSVRPHDSKMFQLVLPVLHVDNRKHVCSSAGCSRLQSLQNQFDTSQLANQQQPFIKKKGVYV